MRIDNQITGTAIATSITQPRAQMMIEWRCAHDGTIYTTIGTRCVDIVPDEDPSSPCLLYTLWVDHKAISHHFDPEAAKKRALKICDLKPMSWWRKLLRRLF